MCALCGTLLFTTTLWQVVKAQCMTCAGHTHAVDVFLAAHISLIAHSMCLRLFACVQSGSTGAITESPGIMKYYSMHCISMHRTEFATAFVVAIAQCNVCSLTVCYFCMHCNSMRYTESAAVCEVAICTVY